MCATVLKHCIHRRIQGGGWIIYLKNSTSCIYTLTLIYKHGLHILKIHLYAKNKVSR